MLNPLSRRTVDTLLSKCSPTFAAKDVSEILITANGVQIKSGSPVYGPDGFYTIFIHEPTDDTSHSNFLGLVRLIWDGDVTGLVRIEVVTNGYAVHSLTSIIDNRTGAQMKQIRVGPLVD